MNHELKELDDNLDLIATVKTQRLKWFGHNKNWVDQAPKIMYERNPERKRKQGGSRKRWSENVNKEIKRQTEKNGKTSLSRTIS